MREPDGFGPHVAMACATTKPSGWIFGRLFKRRACPALAGGNFFMQYLLITKA
jgi:hypothetical protein